MAPWPVRPAVVAAALLALGGGATALAPGPTVVRTEVALLVQTALALAVFDARTLAIPDAYSLAFAVAGVAGPLAPGLAEAAAGATVGAGLLGGVRFVAGRRLGREAMGLGDVKLAAALGALLGPVPLLWSVAGAAAVGVALALATRTRLQEGRLPLGALLAPAGVCAVWWMHLT